MYIVRVRNLFTPCLIPDAPQLGGQCPVIGALNVDADGNAAASWSSAPHGSALPWALGANGGTLGDGFQFLLSNPSSTGNFYLVLEKVPATTDSTVAPGPSAIYLGPLQ